MPHGSLLGARRAAAARALRYTPKRDGDAVDDVLAGYQGYLVPPAFTNGAKDRDEHVAIGESDRMTLKLLKP